VRIVAAETLARLVGDGAKDSLRKMLAAEQETVKLAAARALANLGDRETLAVFIKLLESEDVKIRSRSIQSLRAYTQQKLAFAPYDPVEARVAAVKGWQKWLTRRRDCALKHLPQTSSRSWAARSLLITDALIGTTRRAKTCARRA
jgi:HEAT repeat protein